MTALVLAAAAVAALLSAVLAAGLDGTLGKVLVLAGAALLVHPALTCWVRPPTRPGRRTTRTAAHTRS
jgi:hypothetical protein